MNAEELARKFDNRAGFRLVDYRRVGLPVFAIRLDAVVEERRSLGLLEEYVLRFVDAGISSLTQISQLLAMPKELVMQVAADLLRKRRLDGTEDSVFVTAVGRKELNDVGNIECRDEQLGVAFDGILRRPFPWDPVSLVRHRELASDGCFELLMRAQN